MPGLRRRLRFHGLKRAKVRQDMNKYNLYNLSRMSVPFSASRTYFQQKWTAKAQTRAYHGEQIKEKQWQQMFSRVPNAVVPMNPDYLATNDGSEQAAGRGSGLEVADPKDAPRQPKRMPFMQMVYAPTERRLDTAIFRALFASSARQARQFVTHGQVKVNGKKMLYPGYLLNPGDMFQVEPERAMYATGAFKNASGTFAVEPESTEDNNASDAARAEADAAETATEDNALSFEDIEAELSHPEEDTSTSSTDPTKLVTKTLNSMRMRALSLVTDNKKSLSGKRLQELRTFAKSIKSTLSRPAAATPSTIDDLESQLASLSLKIDGPPSSPTASEAAVAVDHLPPSSNDADIQTAITRISENPYDPSKPYATPWQPREWMSAFAFIPRYLEVNHKICAAVYLRHPAVMPGFAEVPTPFGAETGQLAFNWYLRRR